MIPSQMHDIGSYITSRFGDFVSVTAGAGTDGAEVSGPWVDRQGFDSAKIVIAYETVLAHGETLTLAGNIQDATDNAGTSSADHGDTLASAVQATADSGGSTENGVAEFDVDLSGANQFIRAQFTPTMSAAGTDTANCMAVVLLGGAQEVPAS